MNSSDHFRWIVFSIDMPKTICCCFSFSPTSAKIVSVKSYGYDRVCKIVAFVFRRLKVIIHNLGLIGKLQLPGSNICFEFYLISATRPKIVNLIAVYWQSGNLRICSWHWTYVNFKNKVAVHFFITKIHIFMSPRSPPPHPASRPLQSTPNTNPTPTPIPPLKAIQTSLFSFHPMPSSRDLKGCVQWTSRIK